MSQSTNKIVHLTGSFMEKESHDVVYNFLRDCVKSIKKREADHRDFRDIFSVAGAGSIADFRTIRLSGPRRMGHSMAALRLSEEFQSSIIFYHNMDMAKRALQNYDALFPVPSARELPSNLRRSLQSMHSEIGFNQILEWKPSAIFVDVWEAWPENKKDKLSKTIKSAYGRLPYQQMPFIFLLS